MPRARPTLGQAFVVAILGLAALLALLAALFAHASREGIVRSADAVRKERAERIGRDVERYLDQAAQAVRHIENQIRFGACRAEDALSVEQHLFGEVLNSPDLAEVAFTHAVGRGHAEDGAPLLAPENRWQVAVYRETENPSSPIHSRFTFRDRGRFVTDLRQRAAGGALLAAPLQRAPGEPADPTEHLTFATPAEERFAGQLLWSDLSHAEMDEARPEEQRRVVVTVLKALADASGRFAGVVRVAILETNLDALAAPRAGEPERTFLCDDRGRLITRLTPGDRLHETDGDLRIAPERVTPELAAALTHPLLREVGPSKLYVQGRFEQHGRPVLLSFQGLPETQGWRVGVVVPEDEIQGIRELQERQREMLLLAAGLIGVILLGGSLVLRSVRRDLAGVVTQTARMREFDFAPAPPRAEFRDVEAVLDGMEQAKTALRAMGKYVPVALVRQLFQTKREPSLGGELRMVTILFTDIEDFTSYAERLSPDALAEALGRYFEAMTAAVHATGGTIDKYIGDAVMAVWNAPSPVEDHALRACRAALDCAAACDALYAAAAWGDRPRFVTRFGIHTAEVMVGHFGAPDRLSYTVIGDGVNLAARLEGLNKQYGTNLLVSDAMHEATKDAFAFRRLDRVAVKGRTQGCEVYELLGDARSAGARIALAHAYERALAHYLASRFEEAIAILEPQAAADPPSAVLLRRCREYRAAPPPDGWDGVYVSRTK